jgi:cytochrome c-type biogenesis protein CcmH
MTDSASQPGIDIPYIKNQLNQLKGLFDSGALKADAYQEAKEALERKLVDWALLQAPTEQAKAMNAPTPAVTQVSAESASTSPVAQAEEQTDDKPSKGSLPKVAVALALVVVAGGGYYLFGRSEGTPVMPLPATSLSSPLMPKQAPVASTPEQAPHSTQVGDIATMADRLAARLAKQPNDPQGWAMLGRSYAVLGSPAEAVKAYEKALKLLPDDKALKADYATALAEVKKNNLAAGGGPVSQAPTVTQNQAQPAIQTPAAANASVSGTVSLAPALLKTVQPTDTVFIVARPESGSRMPLAAVRKQVKDLPLQFTLDDSMGMSPAIKLSTAGKVIVSARVSKSGNAIPEKGDLSGETAPVVVGSKGLSVVINTAVK